ncbi:hypothetical protein LINPERPRIM_LOCUS30757 [Linum perenne]
MLPLIITVLVLAISCSSVLSSISEAICYGPYEKQRKCNPEKWTANATQVRVFKTLKFDIFFHGRESNCVPFDIKTGKNQTLTVFSYFACNYDMFTGDHFVDERDCDMCRNRGIRNMRKGCLNSVGAVSKSNYCCLRYETYNMCNTSISNQNSLF